MDATGSARPLVLAFYLPQFHPVPENDVWWGRGFTEWTNVVRATPAFDGHYQPHLPGELGFYDLRLPEVRAAQADLARRHGVDGFVYYHYWFAGRRILEQPFDEVLESGKPTLPFALCWANENWTRTWDAGQREVLIEQHHDEVERAAHIDYLVRAFADPRYLRVDDGPLFFIYNVPDIDDVAGFVADLRQASKEAGQGDPHVVKFDTFAHFEDPAEHACDAAAQFLPHGLIELGIRDRIRLDGHDDRVVLPYDRLAEELVALPAPDWVRYECIATGWDNAPRQGAGGGFTVHGSTPELYEAWLERLVARAPERAGGRGMVLINAWNEWAEGAHLEPDLRWGDAYLRATARVVLGHDGEPASSAPPPEEISDPADFERLYTDLYQQHRALLQHLSEFDMAAERRSRRLAASLQKKLDEQRETALKLAEQLEWHRRREGKG